MDGTLSWSDRNSPINLILIGAGPHAQQFYMPGLRELQSRFPVHIAAVVELKQTEEAVRSHLSKYGFDPELIFVEPFGERIPPELEARLTGLVEAENVNGVIIATEPLTHKVYADWALRSGLNILLDKPITSRRNVVRDIDQACGLVEDYHSLARLYEDLQTERTTCFTVCTHRRFHPGINWVIKKISEVSCLTKCPVTSIHSYHCDGQWRLPCEIVSQEHHTYNQGYGKASHSGYHFFDCIYRFVKAGAASGKLPDGMRVFTSFVEPPGLLKQLTQQDYEHLFGPQYRAVRPFNDDELRERYEGFGEIDVDAVIAFTSGGTNVAQASVNLMHNGFSRRAWMHPGKDLYKGNGRVKHEQHRIHVGPFLGIQVHSYQAKDKHERSGPEDLEFGGNNHFEIKVFHNSEMLEQLGYACPPLQSISLSEIAETVGFDQSRLFIEQVKLGAIIEFLEFISGKRTRRELSSSIEDHCIPVEIMSSVYVSHNLQREGRNPLVFKDLASPLWNQVS